ncbi:glycosyltransferase family 2 protein [Geotalea sp. SG265]|uniref:glycosyltransferase family 2 protein n=1 Tax=Geotalea sp. SG265 TaxID=2922867 RepID=UPI001FAF27E0|nr:glycosyltransferase family 2 protein [Geotalea sp. SG265]
MKPRASIIIVNWNGIEHLPSCLDSLAAQSFRDFEVILVDNGSTDGSSALLRDRYPWVKLVELAENTGFATGNNIGLTHASGDYIVTLNNDTFAATDWLATIVAVADGYPEAGMVGSRICSYDEPDMVDSIGVGICRDGMSRGRFRRQRFSSLGMADVEEILLPSACVALYRRAMLEETGFFDDDFFAYAEDTDLGLRCRLAGWKALLATRAVVYHKYSMTGGFFSPLKLYLVERNHYWAALKTFPPGMLLLVPFFTLIRYVEQGRSILSGHGSGGEFLASGSRWALIAALLKGQWHAVLGVPRMLRKRRSIMGKRKIGSRDISRLLQQYRLTFRELLDRG